MADPEIEGVTVLFRFPASGRRGRGWDGEYGPLSPETGEREGHGFLNPHKNGKIPLHPHDRLARC